ncbi:MAG: hypothetical protein COU71_00645 [Parcubacteria group bacterium CG10_big_fil_rev_8_21_14_0_10_38_31]|nr:MAG: hypothetical protein COU71_00645 [Parcubacteria group bacterium CG10_big_fil_rev_8_21_14_0_10_38_31]
MISETFFNIFPTPRFLKPLVYGLDISDRSIKYVMLGRHKGEIVLKEFGQRMIPGGLIEIGDIKKKDELTRFLKDFRKELHSDHIAVILPEEKAYISKVTIPLMKKSDVRRSLDLQLEENIPLSASETIFDYDISKDKNHYDINIIAFSDKVVNDYRDVFSGAGFNPVSFEMEAHALTRALTPIGKIDDEVKMIIDFGRTHTSFIVTVGNMVMFSSTIRVSGIDIDSAIAGAIAVDLSKAEEVKKEKGFAKTKENEKVYDAILPIISTIKEEVDRIFAFWLNREEEHGEKRKKISKIILSGGDSNLIGLPEFISYELKIPVEVANPWINILSFDEKIPSITFRESLIYSTALGLALRVI